MMPTSTAFSYDWMESVDATSTNNFQTCQVPELASPALIPHHPGVKPLFLRTNLQAQSLPTNQEFLKDYNVQDIEASHSSLPVDPGYIPIDINQHRKTLDFQLFPQYQNGNFAPAADLSQVNSTVTLAYSGLAAKIGEPLIGIPRTGQSLADSVAAHGNEDAIKDYARAKSQESRFKYILEAVDSAGFSSFDEMATEYYTTKLGENSPFRSTQELSRYRHLKGFLQSIKCKFERLAKS